MEVSVSSVVLFNPFTPDVSFPKKLHLLLEVPDIVLMFVCRKMRF